MQYLKVTEYERIPRTEQNRKLLSRIQGFDETWCGSGREPIFDWYDRRFVRARNYVGVIAVPGGSIEILPKIDKSDEPGKMRAQHNLLYMLSMTRKIVGEDRDLATIGTQKMPLLEQLIVLFAARTLSELKRGIDHTYVTQEENLRCLKGKLLLRQHAAMNALHRERLYCRYDDFISDTPINRILKAASRRLLFISKAASAQKKLREILFLLDEVTDLEVAEHHFADVHYNRNTERFQPLVNFSLLVLKGMSPTWTMGKENSFSLLFPMEQLFEEFIARYIHRYADQLGLSRECIHAQAIGRREWLLKRESDSCGSYRLKPDLIIESLPGKSCLILDTKWKHLLSDAEDAKNGVSQADIYQLYAYAHRYECPDNILLFPYVDGVSRKSYVIQGNYCNHRIRVEFVKLNRDLRTDGPAFRDEIGKVLKADKVA
ncbi:McrC family protein [Geomobilimonas luticola]|uniref:McrC family protein n=1 Tax=Geomobilimonas luticola TaxID=1114878 RepID=A0ABS5SAA3_9BACT|nr:McrC family protein [Geomobilimonas luticola]MBT0651542.1 McrC family protein [Geomobilimonas luticola]